MNSFECFELNWPDSLRVFVIDEREPKAELKPMTCISQSGLWGAPKTQFQNLEVRTVGGCERQVVAGNDKGRRKAGRREKFGKRNNFHNGAALSEWKTQLWANCGRSMRVKLKSPFSRT